MEKLLRLLAKRCGSPGGETTISYPDDFTLIDAKEPQELVEYINYCEKSGLLSAEQLGTMVICRLKIDGWQRVEPLSISGGVFGRCFIVMSFDDSLDEAYLCAGSA
jgi:hypothetical protein